MIYYIKINKIFDKSDVIFLNKHDEKIATITFKKQSDEYQLEAFNLVSQKRYFIKSHPLRLKNRYTIFDENKKEIIKVTLGYKILHSIIQSEDYYFVKSSFWKIRYNAYMNRKVTHRLNVIKNENGRFFKLDAMQGDFAVTLALYLLAHAVRVRSILK